MSLYSTQETTSDAQGEDGRHQHIAGHLNAESHVRPVKIAWVLEVSNNMSWRNYRHIDMFRSCEDFFCLSSFLSMSMMGSGKGPQIFEF